VTVEDVAVEDMTVETERSLRESEADAARAESAWVALGAVYSARLAGDQQTASSKLVDGLADPRGADLLADDLVVHAHAPDEVEAFAAWLAGQDGAGQHGAGPAHGDATAKRNVAAARLIESRQAEAAGDVERARELVDATLAADPDFGPARWDAAWHAALRDDYAAALAHLGQLAVGADDADVRHWTLAQDWRSGRTGGSAPCVCGSGRHQKRCCGKDGMELHLLWWKLSSFLFRASQRGVVLNVAAALAGLHADDDDLDTRLGSTDFEDALVHPLTASLALVAGGLAARYREVWGPVSSEAEQRLLDLMAGSRVDVWVVPSDVGKGGVGKSEVRSLDGRQKVVLRNPGALASVGSGPGCVVAAVTGGGSKRDAYLLGTPVRLRQTPVEGPPIEVAHLLHESAMARSTEGGDAPTVDLTAMAIALAPFVDVSPTTVRNTPQEQ